MLSYQKNKLINLLLQFEMEFNKLDDISPARFYKHEIDSIKTIYRNIESIKKQIKKL